MTFFQLKGAVVHFYNKLNREDNLGRLFLKGLFWDSILDDASEGVSKGRRLESH